MTHRPTHTSRAAGRPSMTTLIARSSLGTRAASEARARVAHDRAAAIVARAARRPTAVRPQNVGGQPG